MIDSKPSLLIALVALGLAPVSTVYGHEYIQIEEAWSRATPPTARYGAAYFELSVSDDHHKDRLVAASATVAEHATLHTTIMEGEVMKMRPLTGVDVVPGEVTSFKPGGHHVMLMGLTAPLTVGQTYPLTLTFEQAGEIAVEVTVRGLSGDAPPDRKGHRADDHMHHTSTAGGTASASDQHHGHGAGMHEPVNLQDAATAPHLEVVVHEDAAGGWNLQLITNNFRFAPEHVNGPSVPGEGHAHVYVDGHKFARVYGEWFHLPAQAPGKHELRVTLNANGHGHYALHGKPIEYATEIHQK